MPRSREQCIPATTHTHASPTTRLRSESEAICGSPIEVALLRALIASGERLGWGVTVRWERDGVRRDYATSLQHEGSPTQCWLTLQPQLGPYRADFLVTACHASRADGTLTYWESAPHVVECDGHEWHSSRERRTADAQRDRHLAAYGYRPVRLTGTEIHRDPALCALDVLRLLRVNLLRAWKGPVLQQADATAGSKA